MMPLYLVFTGLLLFHEERALRLYLTALAGFLLPIAEGSAEAAVVVPNGFEVRTVAAGLSLPTAITWAPDGRMFIAQKKGTVLVVNPNGTTQQLLDISSHVYGVADRPRLRSAARP